MLVGGTPPTVPLAVTRPVPRFAHVTNLLPFAEAGSRRQAVLTLALLAATSTPPLAALAAAELSEEQSVIVEAWAVVQRGYVDQQFGGKDWKAIKSDYLKRKYTSMAQARAAVSAMLAELGDKYTRYLTPGAYEALLAKYERSADNGGIGVTVRNVPGTPSTVEIVCLLEDAPAAAAGLRVGDVFETIDRRPLRLPRPTRRATHRAAPHNAPHTCTAHALWSECTAQCTVQ